MIQALPCIVCGCELEGCCTPNQPLDGLAFSTKGHYGTAIFDPMDGSALEINVCDRCLTTARLKGGRVLRYPPPLGDRRPTPEPWLDDVLPET